MLLQAILVIGTIVAFLQTVIVYLRDSKRLRKFPSPSLAGLSSIWRILQNLKYQHFKAIHGAHEQLGSHVRIAPNHISVSDPRAMTDIYGHGAGLLKDAWYDGGAGEFRHMADTRNKAEHQSKRKLLAHVFASKTIANLEPIISDTISTMLLQIDQFACNRQPINMRRYLNYYTIDTFSRLLTSKSLGCLSRGNDVVSASTPSRKTYQVPFIKSLHDATHINTILDFEAPLLPITKTLFSSHPYSKAGVDYENIIYNLVSTRLRDTTIDSTTSPDIFSKLLHNNKNEPLNLPLGALVAEGVLLMNAGTDTTAAALTNMIFLLTKHPSVLSRLRTEVDDAFGNATTIPAYSILSELPYLRACIEESLRLRPASMMGLPRVVPTGGRIIAGQFIPGDTTVSVPTYTLLRDPVCFAPDPESFRPDRWLTSDSEEKAKMARAHFPFSTGPRACIGRNIAYFEQVLVIATLVRNYDFEFVGGKDFELETIERFNGNPGEMEMWVSKRDMV